MREVQINFPRGKVIRERYIVEEMLGKGGFSAVYRVRDRRVRSNMFALKEVIDPSGHERNRLAFECELLKRLDHPGLPRVYRVLDDERNNRIYMLMDYVEGPNLERLRQQQPEKRFSLPRVMRILGPIVEALNYLHTQHPPIIHRDIKPSNIIVPLAGDGDGAVLVDFGIAKEYDQDSTTTAVRHCSPGYGAPEHYARGTNTRTDIYGLAATFYTLLTGSVPVDALYRMTQIGSKHEDPLEPVNVLVPEIPQHIADAIGRAMAINSNDRFATVEEFWQALEPDAIEKEEPAPPPVVEPVLLTDASDAKDMMTPPVLPDSEKLVLNETPEVRIHRTRRSVPFAFVLAMLIIVGLLAGTLFGVSEWSRSAGTPAPASKAPPTQVPLTPTAQAKSTTPANSPTPVSTPQPSPAPSASYPVLVVSYSGDISDEFTNPSTNSTMSLSSIQQHGAAISGYFSVGQGLIGNGNFNGSVTLDNKIQFLVPGNGSIAPLFFNGQIQKDGTLSGSYCSQRNGQCNQAIGGFGSWSISPTSGQQAMRLPDTPSFEFLHFSDLLLEERNSEESG
ncbi:MAG: protein kinase [Ktedonobacteraceae bacterium]|nr:protein kinase [Ktedonobacteraceae bacterium]